MYWVGSERLLRTDPHRAPGRGQRAAFHAGWLIATLALVSPLCPLSVSLFAARVSQHVVLTLIAAPLVACALPARCLLCALRLDRGVPHGVAVLARALAGAPLAAAAAFAMLIWFWHAPAAYEATFRSVAVYWLMHLSLFGERAVAVDVALLREGADRAAAGPARERRLSSVQMGLLGALITLAPRAVLCAAFADHRGLGPDAAAGPAAGRRHHVGAGLQRVPARRDDRARRVPVTASATSARTAGATRMTGGARRTIAA